MAAPVRRPQRHHALGETPVARAGFHDCNRSVKSARVRLARVDRILPHSPPTWRDAGRTLKIYLA